jgi:ferredoxin--NADP+ reductase
MKHIKGTITARREITANLWILRICPEERIPFSPGQYLTVGLPAGDRLLERPYSVVSAPHEPELEFFLEIVRGGRLSGRLCEAPAGSEVYLRPSAKGKFILDESERHHFMAATVTGIAPFVSMLRTLSAAATPGAQERRIVVVHSASVSAELAYREELERLAAAAGWIRYIPTVSRIWLDPGWAGERGRVEDVARKYLDAAGAALPSMIAYLCGNPQMIHNMEGILERAGIPKGNVRRELYWPGD